MVTLVGNNLEFVNLVLHFCKAHDNFFPKVPDEEQLFF
jgi:hypothetical protein